MHPERNTNEHVNDGLEPRNNKIENQKPQSWSIIIVNSERNYPPRRHGSQYDTFINLLDGDKGTKY